MIKYIREIEVALGRRKKVTKSEKKNKDIIRKSIVAKIDIYKRRKIFFKKFSFQETRLRYQSDEFKKNFGKKSKKL